MPSDIFKAIGNQPTQPSQPTQPTQQNPREQALALMQQQGISVPDNIANNPQAIIQHLMQTGAIPQQRLNMAQQILSRFFRR